MTYETTLKNKRVLKLSAGIWVICAGNASKDNLRGIQVIDHFNLTIHVAAPMSFVLIRINIMNKIGLKPLTADGGLRTRPSKCSSKMGFKVGRALNPGWLK